MFGAVAQLGEHLFCKQEVTGSSPVSSTSWERSLAASSHWRLEIALVAL